MAINGDGFFTVKTKFGNAYTRDGSMRFIKEGFLTTTDGGLVMGYEYDKEGRPLNALSPIQVSEPTIPAEATKKLNFQLNLDARSKVKEFNIENPDETSNFSTHASVYDSLGTPRGVTIFFNKLEENTWEYRALVDGKEAEGGEEGKMVEMAQGTLLFDDKGRLEDVEEGYSNFSFTRNKYIQKYSF